MSKVYPALLKRLTIRLRSLDFQYFFLFIYQISIEFWIRNTLLQKFQTEVIFFDQFKVPTIKFGKCFVEFMIPIALLKEIGS